MSTPNKSATAGAGPSAAISAEPGRHVACRPPDVSAPRAAWSLTGSGPNSAAYCSGVTVWPEAMSLASWSGERALRPRLRSTWVAVPARPRCAAWAIAVLSEGVGELRFLLTGAGGVDCGELHAVAAKITTAASARNPRIGSVWRFRPTTRLPPRSLTPASRRRPGRDLADFGQCAPNLLLQLGLDLMGLLKAHIAGQLRDHVRVDAVVPIAQLDIDAAFHGGV